MRFVIGGIAGLIAGFVAGVVMGAFVVASTVEQDLRDVPYTLEALAQ